MSNLIKSIKKVTYRRLRTFGNYENEAIEATTEVPDGIDPSEMLSQLTAWVSGKLDANQAAKESSHLLAEQARRLKVMAADVNDELDQLKTRRDNAVALLKKHGVNTEVLEGIPF